MVQTTPKASSSSPRGFAATAATASPRDGGRADEKNANDANADGDASRPSPAAAASAPPPAGPDTGSPFAPLVRAREAELAELAEDRLALATAQETALAETRAELAATKGKFASLRGDFHYNLRLLRERDAELEKFDGVLAAKDAQVEELRGRLEDAAAEIARWKDAEARSAAEIERAREDLSSSYDEMIKERETTHAATLAEETRRAIDAEASVAALNIRCEDLARRLETDVTRARERFVAEYEKKCEASTAALKDAESAFEQRRKEWEAVDLATSASAARERARAEGLESELEAMRKDLSVARDALADAARDVADGAGLRAAAADAASRASAAEAASAESARVARELRVVNASLTAQNAAFLSCTGDATAVSMSKAAGVVAGLRAAASVGELLGRAAEAYSRQGAVHPSANKRIRKGIKALQRVVSRSAAWDADGVSDAIAAAGDVATGEGGLEEEILAVKARAKTAGKGTPAATPTKPPPGPGKGGGGGGRAGKGGEDDDGGGEGGGEGGGGEGGGAAPRARVADDGASKTSGAAEDADEAAASITSDDDSSDDSESDVDVMNETMDQIAIIQRVFDDVQDRDAAAAAAAAVVVAVVVADGDEETSGADAKAPPPPLAERLENVRRQLAAAGFSDRSSLAPALDAKTTTTTTTTTAAARKKKKTSKKRPSRAATAAEPARSPAPPEVRMTKAAMLVKAEAARKAAAAVPPALLFLDPPSTGKENAGGTAARRRTVRFAGTPPPPPPPRYLAPPSPLAFSPLSPSPPPSPPPAALCEPYRPPSAVAQVRVAYPAAAVEERLERLRASREALAAARVGVGN